MRPSIRRVSFKSGVIAGACGILFAGSACSLVRHRSDNRWLGDYDHALRKAHQSGREILIYYAADRPGMHDPLHELLQNQRLRIRTRRYVRCILVKSFEPDRRYVAQYGVERAPAFIVIHRDNTYHALTGSQSLPAILKFLESAATPGIAGTIDPHVPHRTAYEWHVDLDSARTAARSTGKPLLIVYHRPFTHDWHRLKKLLAHREVYRRLDEMVPLQMKVGRPWDRISITPFGALKLPALVVAFPDGTYDVLEEPTSYVAIAHFADNNQRSAQQRDTANTAVSAGR